MREGGEREGMLSGAEASPSIFQCDISIAQKREKPIPEFPLVWKRWCIGDSGREIIALFVGKRSG